MYTITIFAVGFCYTLYTTMRRYIVYCFLFCFISLKLSAQNLSVVVNYTTTPKLSDAKDLIFYDGKRKLNWSDFRASPDDNSIAAALTDAGFGYSSSYSYSEGKGILTITVYCDFTKDGSWVKTADKNDYILRHEQHHFDISYICTMQFIDKLRKMVLTTSDFNKLIGEAYKETAMAMSAMQNQYDTETQHGLIKDKQQEWSDKIDQQLEALQPPNAADQ